MGLKNILLAAAVGLGFVGTAAHAATCSVGTCGVTGADGQDLSTMVQFDIDNIVGDGGGNFTFEADFFNDTTGNGVAVAAFLVSVTQGSISDLMLNITAPGSVVASYSLVSDVVRTIDLLAAPGETITFTLTGIATKGTFGGDPDINLTLAPAVPLPAGIVLMGTALAGFGVARRRRKS